MITKCPQAKITGAPVVELWVSRTPVQEFMYIDDLADSLVYLLNHYADPTPINVGMGQGTTIRDLDEIISKVVGYEGTLHWDADRLDGMPKRMLDSSRLTALGWQPSVSLEDGLAKTYAWYQDQVA